MPYAEAARPALSSSAEGFEDVEFEAVIGCDSAARGRMVFDSGLLASPCNGSSRETFNDPSPGRCRSCGGFSSPFSQGDGACDEPAALDRREGSLVIAMVLFENFQLSF